MAGPLSKPPREWAEADIAALVTNGVKESIDLDYKECPSLQKTDGRKREISKDVSAFANAAGGTIVYGVIENGRVPTGIDTGYDPADITKEWLEQVINSTIKPRLGGVVINQVELPASHPGRVLYVVDVPQAVGGDVHQASDHKFYKRFNFESVPMEYYEILDVMRRSVGADLYARVRVLNAGDDQTFDLAVVIGNASPGPVLYAHVDLYIDDRLDLGSRGFLAEAETNVACTLDERPTPMKHLWREWVAPESPPIWKGHEQGLTPTPHTLRLIRSTKHDATAYNLVVVLKAPRMAPRHQVFAIGVGGWPSLNLTPREGVPFACGEF
jgi:hypothetical protein